MKRIWPGAVIFSLDLPNLFLLERTICSIISCILSLRDCVCFVSSSSWSCMPRNSWTSSSLSSLFSCSSVYLNAITRTPCLWYTDSDYSRFSVWTLILPCCLSGKMTVDNPFEKLLSNGFTDGLSTHDSGSVSAVCCPGIIFVDKHIQRRFIHCQGTLYIFLFSAFCTIHMRSGVFVTSVIGCLAMISSPCISIRYWSSVIAIASSAVLGQRKEPLSNLLYRRRNPSPSHRSALILSFLLPQKRKSVFLSYGSSVYWKRTMDARPSIPRRRSVKPGAR